MVHKVRSGVVLGLSTLIALSGASATPPGAIEVKGVLEALSAESITVAGVSCTANAQTKIEGNPQLGQQVELKYFEGVCLELEREGAEGNSQGSGNQKTNVVNAKAKLKEAAPAGGSGSGSNSRNKNKAEVKFSSYDKEGKHYAKLNVEAIIRLAVGGSVSSVELRGPGVRCPLTMKTNSNEGRKKAGLKLFLIDGQPKNPAAQSPCAAPPVIAEGDPLELVVDGTVVASGSAKARTH